MIFNIPQSMRQQEEYFPQGSFRGPPQPRILVNNKNRQRLRKPEPTKQQVFIFHLEYFQTFFLLLRTHINIHTRDSPYILFHLEYFQIIYRLLHYQIETLSQGSKQRAPPVLSKRKLLMPVIISSYASTNIQGKSCILSTKRS